MKYLPLLALLFSSHLYANLNATVSGTTISWPNTGGWMQVQNANTYASECDGFISTCTVNAGTYHIIDHSNSTRQDNISVSNNVSPPPQNQSTVARQDCNLPFAYAQQSCIVQCPAGKTIKRIRTCYARSVNPQEILPTNFQSTDSRMWCNIGSYPDPVDMIVEVDCE